MVYYKIIGSLDNSVPFMVKLTLLPYWNIYEKIKNKCFQFVYFVILKLLNNPPLTLVLLSILFFLLLPILLYSFLMTLAVTCFVWTIIIFEGFILLTSISFVTIAIIVIGLTIIYTLSIKNIWIQIKRKKNLCNSYTTYNY